MRKLLLASTAAACITAIAPAHAQVTDNSATDPAVTEDAAQSGGLNVIVVTAQRRQESVQDVPIAISAFDSVEMERRGVSNALDVSQYVPNFIAMNNTGLGSANAYFLRGIGNNESIATFDPPIGTYIDDIYISRQNANNLSMFDVQRVEVLRGPQGTLFGRNTTGGAVNLFMKEPGNELAGYVEAGYGSYENYVARASVDIPLADTFAVKVSGYFQDDKGYAKNTTTGERTNSNDGWGVRLGLRGELSDTARWTGSYMHINTNAVNLLNFDCDPANPNNCDGRFATTGLTKDGNFGGLLVGEKDGYGLGNDTAMDFVSSNLELGSGEDISVNIITGYVYTTQDFALDFADGRALPSVANPTPAVRGHRLGGFTVASEGEFSQFTQEVKVNASVADGLLDLVGGAYYFEEDNYTVLGDVFTIPSGVPLVLGDRTVRSSTRAYAGYLQGDLNITDRLTLTAGIRYTDESKKFSISDNRASCNDGSLEASCLSDVNLFAGNGVAIPRKMSSKIWTPRFAANYELDNNILLFASATRGFKSGGWNARGTTNAELLPFNPEKAWSYEAGIKSEMFDNRLRVNLTAYYLDVADLQTPAGFAKPDGSIAFITRNFADYVNKGIELEINAVPVDGLNLFASAGYMDAKYKIDRNAPALDEYGVTSAASQQAACLAQLAAGLVPGGGALEATSCGAGIVAPDGSIAKPTRTPDFNLSFGGSYEAEFGNGLSLIPSINAIWQGATEVSSNNATYYTGGITSSTGASFPSNPFDGDFIIGSYSKAHWILNSNITLKSVDGWAISAECANCLDQEAIVTSLANHSYLNSPRTFLIKGRFEF